MCSYIKEFLSEPKMSSYEEHISDISESLNRTSLFLNYYKTLSDSEKNNSSIDLYAETLNKSLEKWLQYIGQDIMPRRIEQNVISSNLINEQIDLTSKNDSIDKLQRDQIRVIDRVLTDYYNKGFSSLRHFESSEYKLNKLQFNATAIKYAYFVMFLNMFVYSLTLMGIVPSNISSMVTLFTVLMYIFIFLVKYKSNMSRSKYNWDKFYFGSPEKKKTCKS